MSVELTTKVPAHYLHNGELMQFPYKCTNGHTFEWYQDLDQCPTCHTLNISPAIKQAQEIVKFAESNSGLFPAGYKSNIESFIENNSVLGSVIIAVGEGDSDGNIPLITPTRPDFMNAPLSKFKIGLSCLFGLAVAFITVAVVTSDSSNKNDSSS